MATKTFEEWYRDEHPHPYKKRRSEYESALMFDRDGVREAATVSKTKIDWSRPLTCASVARLRTIDFIDDVTVGGERAHACKITYQGTNDYTYIVLYNDYGESLGRNAGTINIKNKQEFVDRYIVVDTRTDEAVRTYGTRAEAKSYILARGDAHRFYIQHAHYAK